MLLNKHSFSPCSVSTFQNMVLNLNFIWQGEENTTPDLNPASGKECTLMLLTKCKHKSFNMRCRYETWACTENITQLFHVTWLLYKFWWNLNPNTIIFIWEILCRNCCAKCSHFASASMCHMSTIFFIQPPNLPFDLQIVYRIEDETTWAPSQYKDRLIYVWRFPC